jgi:GxxExxY protein
MSIDELTEKVLGACFEVSNGLGIGFLESVYEKALLIALLNRGLKAESQSPIKVFYQKQNVGEFFADIVVEDELIIEIKAVKALAPEHIAQVLNYLKATEKKRGLLVNFGRSKLEFRRFDNRLVNLEGNCHR